MTIDPATLAVKYVLVGGGEVAEYLVSLQKLGWQLVWTSNDPDEAVDIYDAAAKDAGLTFDVRAHGQVLHDLRLDVLVALLGKLQTDLLPEGASPEGPDALALGEQIKGVIAELIATEGEASLQGLTAATATRPAVPPTLCRALMMLRCTLRAWVKCSGGSFKARCVLGGEGGKWGGPRDMFG